MLTATEEILHKKEGKNLLIGGATLTKALKRDDEKSIILI